MRARDVCISSSNRLLSVSINYRVKAIINRTGRSDSGAKAADRALRSSVKGDAWRSLTKISSAGSATHSFCLITINYGLSRSASWPASPMNFSVNGNVAPPCNLASLMRAIKSPSPMDTEKGTNTAKRKKERTNWRKKRRKGEMVSVPWYKARKFF